MQPPVHFRLRTVLIAGMLLMLTGCTEESVNGDTSTFTFAMWIRAVTTLGTLGLTVIGIGLFLLPINKSVRGWSWILVIGGLILFLFLVPAMWLDRATVSPEQFSGRSGLWFSPNKYEFRFEDVASINLTSETRRSRRSTTTSYYMELQFKTSPAMKMPVGDLFKNGPAQRVLQYAAERNIPVRQNGPWLGR